MPIVVARLDRHLRTGGEGDAARRLVGADDLDPDIAGHIGGTNLGADVRLDVTGQQLLADLIGLGGDVVRQVAVEDEDAVGDQVTRVIADHRPEPEVGKIGRPQQILRGDRRFGRAAWKANEKFVGVQPLVAVGVIDPDLDRTEEAAFEFALELAAELDQLVLDLAIIVIARLDA